MQPCSVGYCRCLLCMPAMDSYCWYTTLWSRWLFEIIMQPSCWSNRNALLFKDLTYLSDICWGYVVPCSNNVCAFGGTFLQTWGTHILVWESLAIMCWFNKSFTCSSNVTFRFELHFTWWRHPMETFSALLAFCAGNHRSPVISPHKGQWHRVWCFLWSEPEPTVEQTMETPVIWDAIALILMSL